MARLKAAARCELVRACVQTHVHKTIYGEGERVEHTERCWWSVLLVLTGAAAALCCGLPVHEYTCTFSTSHPQLQL